MDFISKEDSKPLPREREKELAAIIQAGGEGATEAINELVTHNIKFACHIAGKYSEKKPESEDDLVHEAILGMRHAATKYDGGVKFISYAVHWIRTKCQDEVMKNKLVQAPNHSKMGVMAISRFSESGLDPFSYTPEEIYEWLKARNKLGKTTLRNIIAAQQAMKTPRSLDMSLGVMGDPSSDDHLSMLSCPRPLQSSHTEALEASESIREALRTLPDRHRIAIEMRWLSDEQATRYFSNEVDLRHRDATASLDAIGERLGVTRERARQLCNEAYAMLRDHHPELRDLLPEH